MIATVGKMELEILAQQAATTGRIVLVTTHPTGSTLSAAIVEAIQSCNYETVDAREKTNIFTSKHQRQRDWWNTPKKERRRKK
jgi:hypothetical protein